MSDSEVILDKAVELAKRDNLPLIVFGRSLGGAASIHALSRPHFQLVAKGLILENTFTSIFDVAVNLLPKWLLLFYPILWAVTVGSYNSERKLPSIHIPILFVKGCKDMLIPKVQMDQLHQKHRNLNKRHFSFQVKDGTHNDTWVMGGENYFKELQEFMRQSAKL